MDLTWRHGNLGYSQMNCWEQMPEFRKESKAKSRRDRHEETDRHRARHSQRGVLYEWTGTEDNMPQTECHVRVWPVLILSPLSVFIMRPISWAEESGARLEMYDASRDTSPNTVHCLLCVSALLTATKCQDKATMWLWRRTARTLHRLVFVTPAYAYAAMCARAVCGT